jgi:hypothetical protein
VEVAAAGGREQQPGIEPRRQRVERRNGSRVRVFDVLQTER